MFITRTEYDMTTDSKIWNCGQSISPRVNASPTFSFTQEKLSSVTDSWESQLRERILKITAEIDEQFPYIPGYQLRWDSNFDPGDYSDDNNYLRFTNFRYEPIIYFEED